MTADDQAPVAPVPTALRVAGALVGAEGAAAAIAGAGFAVAALAAHPADRATTLTLAGVLLVLGVGVLFVARGLLRRRPAAATPAYLTQFFTLVVAWYQRHTLVVVTVVLAVVAVAAAAALSAGTSRDALRRP
jgi:hypothetical protein